MTETISAMRYADLTNTSIGEVVSKIKSGELKGYSRLLNWYVDDVDVEALRQDSENFVIDTDSSANGQPTTQTTSHDAPAQSEPDTIASALNAFAWFILVAGAFLALYFLIATTGQGIISATTTAGAVLFQALLLMGFARIISYLKIIAEK